MKHMSFKEFLKEDTASADVASVETKLDLEKKDALKNENVKETEEFLRKCKVALNNEEAEETENPKETEENK